MGVLVCPSIPLNMLKLISLCSAIEVQLIWVVISMSAAGLLGINVILKEAEGTALALVPSSKNHI